MHEYAHRLPFAQSPLPAPVTVRPGREVDAVLSGLDTASRRQIVDSLFSPHPVRNSFAAPLRPVNSPVRASIPGDLRRQIAARLATVGMSGRAGGTWFRVDLQSWSHLIDDVAPVGLAIGLLYLAAEGRAPRYVSTFRDTVMVTTVDGPTIRNAVARRMALGVVDCADLEDTTGLDPWGTANLLLADGYRVREGRVHRYSHGAVRQRAVARPQAGGYRLAA